MCTSARDRLREDVLNGRPVSAFDVVDAHAHLGPWHNFNIPACTAAEMVRMMDLVGIRCCIAGAHAGIGPDFRLGNDRVLQAMREFRYRIYGYCCVNPNYPEDEMRDEMERCLDAGMIGIKLHPSLHTYRVGGEGYRAAWETADRHGLCVLSHTAAGESWDNIALFEKIASNYPRAKIILGHSGFGYEGARQSCELARKFPNVYLDITGSAALVGLVDRLVEGAGAERVLFGTDLPFLDCRPQIGRVAFSGLDDDQLAAVLGGNARRLFGI